MNYLHCVLNTLSDSNLAGAEFFLSMPTVKILIGLFSGVAFISILVQVFKALANSEDDKYLAQAKKNIIVILCAFALAIGVVFLLRTVPQLFQNASNPSHAHGLEQLR